MPVLSVARIILLATWGLSGYAAADLKSGLVGEWRFAQSDGAKVTDLSGNGIDGHISCGTLNGMPRALACNGYTTEVEIDEKGQPPISDALTVVAWVRPLAVNKRSIFGKPHADPTFNTPMPGLFLSERGHVSFAAWQSKSKLKGVYEGESEILRGTWVMVGATYGDSTVTLYVNGKPDGKHESFASMNYAPGPLFIGRTKAGSSMFKGLIGEVRMYRRLLSAEEMAAYYAETRKLYPVEVPAPRSPGRTVTVAVRQSPSAPWVDYPTRTLELLDSYKPSGEDVALDTYGGWTGHKEKATGFFYPKKIGTRWWLIDPEGHLFLHVGVVSVSLGNSKTCRENFAKTFTTKENWAEATTAMLHEKRFNGTGAWSDTAQLRGAKKPLAYTVIRNFAADYAKSKGLARASVGHSGFLNDSIPVFGADFPAFCQAKAESLAEMKDDPWLLGYFSDNELLTPVLDKYLKFNADDPVQAANLHAAVAWLAARKGKSDVTVKDITVQDRAEFMGYVFETYFRIASDAIRRADPNHLYLGSRLHSREKENPNVLKAAGKYCDVIAINYYRVWGPDLDEMRDWTTWADKPVIITEWYAKGDDVGFPNTTGAGWIVKTQHDRGLYYQHYALGCIEAGNCVGWHWFKYMDNDLNDTKADPSNRDSNKGIVKIDYTPYTDVLNLMRQLNREVYPLTRFFDGKK
jgi:hypothetical protein